LKILTNRFIILEENKEVFKLGNIEIFNEMARRYDLPERAAIAKVIAGAIRKRVIDGKNKSAIDYGCGTGLVGLQLEDSFKSIVLTDASVNMINVVQEKIDSMNIKNVSALCCDLMKEIPQYLKADYIIMSQVLLHIPDTEKLLSLSQKLLTENGHLIIIDFDKNDYISSDKVHPGFKQEDLKCLLSKLSFSNIESETFYHGEKIFMNQDASLFILEATCTRV
jgi:ubiquinone/menaquinone biosynthesis C-methylase UbiE